MNKYNFDYTLNISISLSSLILHYNQTQTSWGDPIRNSSENMQQIYRATPMQKCDFNNIALHWLILKPGPRHWTWTLDPNPQKQGPWKTWLMRNMRNSWMQKRIGKPQSIIYYNTKILQQEICKQAI